jgi:hypothetical protein
MMMVLVRRYLVEGIVNAAFTSPELLPGKPQIWRPGLDKGDAWRRSSSRALFLE